VLHLGPPGAGLDAKLARNLITYGSWLAAFDAQELAEAAGIDLLKLGGARQSDKRGGATPRMFRTAAAPCPPMKGCWASCIPAPSRPQMTRPPSWSWGHPRRRPAAGRPGRAVLRPHLRLRGRHVIGAGDGCVVATRRLAWVGSGPPGVSR
jgi:hypothetical protein